MSRKQIKISFWLFALSIFVLPFQNCSVYQSDGKKLLDEQGEALLSSSAPTANNNAPSSALLLENESDCSSLLSSIEASDIFEHISVDNKLINDVAAGESTCIFSVNNNSIKGEDTAVCSIAATHQSKLEESVQKGVSELNLQTKEYTEQTAQGFVYNIIGAEVGSLEAIHCRFTFASINEYSSAASTVAERALDLIASIAPDIQ